MEFLAAFGIPFVFIIFILLVVFGGLILNVITSIWAYKDALKMGNSKEYALIVLVGTLFFPIIGIIVYLIIRKN